MQCKRRKLLRIGGRATTLALALAPATGRAAELGVDEWLYQSNQAGAMFGYSLAAAGDVNGDGYSDILAGAPYFDNGQNDEGRAFVFYGSPALPSFVPDWTAESDQDAAHFGFVVAGAGDVNGDGYDDVLIGSPDYDHGEVNEGRAWLYLGSASGLGTSPAWTAEANQASSRYAISVAAAGDVNGDRFADVIVGAIGYDNEQTDEGRAFVYLGSPAGLAAAPSWTIESNQMGANLGNSVCGAGDVNGDGFGDVLVSAIAYDNGQTDEGRVYLYKGALGGLSSTPAWIGEGNQDYLRFGSAAARAGDVNGDGYADVIVGAIGYSNGEANEGRALVYHGTAAGLTPTPAWTLESNLTNALLGYAVATTGDRTGDGFADVAIGAPMANNNQGAFAVAEGSPAGLGPATFTFGGTPGAQAGLSIAAMGDTDGDGLGEFAYSAPRFTLGEAEEGAAFMYADFVRFPLLTPSWTQEANLADSYFGAAASTAGDVNGDGYSDLVVGAPGSSNGQASEGRAFLYNGSATGLGSAPAWSAESNQADALFGNAAATAGDVNGDGYADVLVAASGFDNGQTDEGRVFVYHGSPAGLGAAPAWTAEPNQAQAAFGYSAGGAGDVNGDGYSDIIVGAVFYDDGQVDEGRAYVYAGSPAGLATTPLWTVESDQLDSGFGVSVAGAGDVNGDGYSDVIVGAPTYSNGETREGRAYVYLGAPDGPAHSPAWVAESNQAEARFGHSASTAGDVNGDGYADVIVGAPLFDNGQLEEGRIFVYFGSASGLGTTPFTAEVHAAGSYFGWTVSTAGDLTNDGYSDVIVGAYHASNGEANEGQAFMYAGNAFGLGGAFWVGESNQAISEYGIAVGTAGDVNGDGFADMVVGATGFDNVQINEGRAFLYYGNAGDGLDRIPRQARTDDLAPIELLGRSNFPAGVLLKTLGRTAAGRGRVRLALEVKPLGTPFDGLGLVVGPWSNTSAPASAGSSAPLSALVSGLMPAMRYHWRLRTLSDSPIFPRSRWLWLPGNGPAETDFRTPGVVGIADAPTPPAATWLGEATPNPFSISTELAYELPAVGAVRVAVYDALGRAVAELARGEAPAGRHVVAWDGRDARGRRLPAGAYFIRLQQGDRVVARKVLLAR